MADSPTVRAALVQELSARLPAIVDELTDLMGARIQRIEQDHIDRDWLRISTQANLEVVLHLVANPDDLPLAEPPVGAVSIVHRLAQRGLPFHEIVRGYHLTESRWVQICLQILATMTDDVDVVVFETIELSTLAQIYIDRVCQRIAVEYEVERERFRRQEESARLERVLAVLDGTTEDLPAAEAALSYRLTQNHLAVVVWVDGAENTVDELLRARQAVAMLAELTGCRSRPLIITRGPATVWAWLPIPRSDAIDPAEIEKSISDRTPQLRIALGEAAYGIGGFASSHRQAIAAHTVGSAADVATVVPYREVASLVFLCADLPRARQWVAETLGSLSVDGERERELRRTLGVYCLSNRSATTTARTLNCHKNTILYRLRTIERLLGRPIDNGHIDLDLALLACRWLGPTMLSASD